jgi:hypothetical protein
VYPGDLKVRQFEKGIMMDVRITTLLLAPNWALAFSATRDGIEG